MKTKIATYLPIVLTAVSRILLSVTFIFSGFVKVADPMGMVYKFKAYANALSLPLANYDLLLKVGAVSLGTLEFVLGIYLLLGERPKFTRWTLLIFMSFFTSLTVWIYTANPVADCGCFGDALILSNGETLLKNIVLLLCSVWLIIRRRIPLLRLITKRISWTIAVYAWIYAVGLALYTLHYLPVTDFTPYTVGADIRAAVNGDTNETELSRLANFYICDPLTGEDKTFEILDNKGYTFILTVPNTITADDGCHDRINDLYDYCRENHYAFFMAAPTIGKDLEGWIDRTGAAYPIYMAEETELETMVRSNPGLMLLKDGKIIAKWSNNELPETDDINAKISSIIPTNDFNPFVRLVLWFIIPLVLIIFADKIWKEEIPLTNNYVKRLKHTNNMRKKIVAGNWKMNKNLQEGVALATELNEVLTADKPNCGVIICTPFIHLASVAGVIDSSIIGLGAENCADKVSGAYTGEVSAEMVKSTGAGYVILGHSERRAYYHETAEILKEKVNLALANGLDVIFCIGEVLEEREAGKQNDVVKAQLEGSLFDLTAEQFSHIILAYEPVWAIGTGKTATAEQAEEMHAFIRETIAAKFGAEAAENVSILYGGSCKPSNAKEIFSKPDVDGGLIGGAALKAADFKGIIDAWKA